MLNKIRTPVANVAYQASPQLPRQVQSVVEEDLRLLFSLYVSCMMRGKAEALRSAVGEFCAREIIEVADILRSTQSEAAAPAETCEDWKRGLRNPAGRCTNCGGMH